MKFCLHVIDLNSANLYVAAFQIHGYTSPGNLNLLTLYCTPCLGMRRDAWTYCALQPRLCPWSRVLEKLTVTELVKQFPTCYVTGVTGARHWSLFWARYILSTPSNLIFKNLFNITLPSTPSYFCFAIETLRDYVKSKKWFWSYWNYKVRSNRSERSLWYETLWFLLFTWNC